MDHVRLLELCVNDTRRAEVVVAGFASSELRVERRAGAMGLQTAGHAARMELH